MTEQTTLNNDTAAEMRAASEAGRAFNKAIVDGRLSDDEDVSNYAGNFMFMGDEDGNLSSSTSTLASTPTEAFSFPCASTESGAE